MPYFSKSYPCLKLTLPILGMIILRCSTSISLISLNGSPTEVAGDFDCCNNKLTSLNGCPREVVGDFSCYANKKKFAKYDVKRFCKVIGNIFNI